MLLLARIYDIVYVELAHNFKCEKKLTLMFPCNADNAAEPPEVPHNIELLRVSGEETFCFYET